MHVVLRGLGAHEQPAQEFGPVGGHRDEGRLPADVLVDGGVETRITDHGTEPVLDLCRQPHEARRVSLKGEPDDHASSIAGTGPAGVRMGDAGIGGGRGRRT
ncbi:hypothetical protein Airi01_065420 [Actinoallomurus iriomotensis]|uniref:Uncharacterized protein n=1 Tax=Actinoallomurus iriomotensis TaxID=478107 RepID=A0A9W6VS35_9ACTN|nr:hypothetical protein Airi01_065420 [Actinoallomurus iriomotensis]